MNQPHSTDTCPPAPISNQDSEAEYSATVQMVIYESQLFWTIMGVFLLAETLLAGFLLGVAPKETPVSFRILGSVLGLFTTWLWLVAILRAVAYHRLRIFQARELDRRLGFSLFVRAEPFANGQEIVVDGANHQQPWLARWPSIKQAGILLSFGFAFLFLIILVMEILRVLCN